MSVGRVSSSVLLAETVVAGVVNCAHQGTVVVANARGDVLWSAGRPERLVLERSTFKPLRALACVQLGAADAFAIEPRELALIAGSHSGTAAHVAIAGALARKIDVGPGDIAGGRLRLPLGDDGLAELVAGKSSLGPFHGECSGEHLGLLAICRHLGLDHLGYWEGDHAVHASVNDAISRSFADFCAASVTATDGCLLPTSARPLLAVAKTFAQFACAAPEAPGARVVAAMSAHPRTFTGHGRFVGDLIEASSGEIVGKCGADGLYVIGWRAEGVALAVKVDSGAHYAAVPAIRFAAARAGLPFPPTIANDHQYSGIGELVCSLESGLV